MNPDRLGQIRFRISQAMNIEKSAKDQGQALVLAKDAKELLEELDEITEKHAALANAVIDNLTTNSLKDGSSDDLQLKEDPEISAAHPMRTGRHDLFVEAMRLVGAKHSKAALVGLVNWLLFRIEGKKK